MRRLLAPFLTTTISLGLLHAACDSSSGSSSSGSFDASPSGSFDAGGTSSGDATTSGSSSGGSTSSTSSSGGSTSSSSSSGSSGSDAGNDAAVDAGAPGTIASPAKAAVQKDFVGGGDQAFMPDGTEDGTISARIVGPVDGLILVTTDGAGIPAGGQQWDTIVLDDALPDIGTGFTTGSQTWCLGVDDAMGNKLNDANGRINLGAGAHDVTLTAAPSGFFNAGQAFRLYARTGGNWIAGPVFTW